MAEDANGSELVTVFDTERESEALVVKGLLQSGGIEVEIFSLDSPQDVFPGVGGVVVKVPLEQAEEARAIIADYGNRPVEDSELPEGSSA
jgi:hypothetical protein